MNRLRWWLVSGAGIPRALRIGARVSSTHPTGQRACRRPANFIVAGQLRQAVRQAGGHADLQQRLEAVVGPSFGRVNPTEPLPRLKRNLEVILRQNEQRLRQQLRQRNGAGGPGANGHLLSQPLRASLSSLAYALAFAALPRRRGKRISLLASLLFSGRLKPLQDSGHLDYQPDQD